jgi:hypothetical protein
MVLEEGMMGASRLSQLLFQIDDALLELLMSTGRRSVRSGFDHGTGAGGEGGSDGCRD